ncbi:MAG: ASCH domain-containing protein [Dactylosporangium sp.]|nr:ASCH domain-containing protein [Dactylosporangium sp.]
MQDLSDTPSGRELNTRKPYLRLISEGTKTVDVRVGSPGVRTIAAGQDLTFVAGTQSVRTRVKRVSEYASFEAMLDREESHAIGGSLCSSRGQLLAVIRSIFPADQERLGVLAIEIERI